MYQQLHMHLLLIKWLYFVDSSIYLAYTTAHTVSPSRLGLYSLMRRFVLVGDVKQVSDLDNSLIT